MSSEVVWRCQKGEGGRPCGRAAAGTAYDLTQCLDCWQAARSAARLAASIARGKTNGGTGLDIPCVHLGGECRRKAPRAGGGHPGNLRLRQCAVWGECTVSQAVEGLPCCAACEARVPDTATLVAPYGTRGRPGQWLGRLPKKPWQYRVSACIAHIQTPDQLAVVIETLRWQTERPYIIVVDTGSSPDVCQKIEAMRREDVEIHFVRAGGYRHPSEPVAVALDLAHSICHTEYLYHTHADVFIRRRDWLEWLLARCDRAVPVVGYEMSERDPPADWRGTVSHTATMLHMPTMRRVGATWNMQAWYEARGMECGVASGSWPDTEAMMRLSLDRAGIAPLFVEEQSCPGAKHERNYTRDVDCNIEHVRSFPSATLYGSGSKTAANEMPAAMAAAAERVAQWRHISYMEGGSLERA